MISIKNRAKVRIIIQIGTKRAKKRLSHYDVEHDRRLYLIFAIVYGDGVVYVPKSPGRVFVRGKDYFYCFSLSGCCRVGFIPVEYGNVAFLLLSLFDKSQVVSVGRDPHPVAQSYGILLHESLFRCDTLSHESHVDTFQVFAIGDSTALVEFTSLVAGVEAQRHGGGVARLYDSVLGIVDGGTAT